MSVLYNAAVAKLAAFPGAAYIQFPELGAAAVAVTGNDRADAFLLHCFALSAVDSINATRRRIRQNNGEGLVASDVNFCGDSPLLAIAT